MDRKQAIDTILDRFGNELNKLPDFSLECLEQDESLSRILTAVAEKRLRSSP